MPGSVLSVCVPAPSDGVFVEAPEKIPSTAAGSKSASQPMSGALDRAEDHDRRREHVQLHPLLPQRREEAGAELQADREDKQDQPELLHEIERVVIDRFAEVPDEDPREQHARRAEPDAAELQAPERHAQHAHEREHADGVRDGLRFVKLEEPVHRVTRCSERARLSPRRSRRRRRSRSSC